MKEVAGTWVDVIGLTNSVASRLLPRVPRVRVGHGNAQENAHARGDHDYAPLRHHHAPPETTIPGLTTHLQCRIKDFIMKYWENTHGPGQSLAAKTVAERIA